MLSYTNNPGVLFYSKINKTKNMPYLYKSLALIWYGLYDDNSRICDVSFTVIKQIKICLKQ